MSFVATVILTTGHNRYVKYEQRKEAILFKFANFSLKEPRTELKNVLKH